MSVKVDSLVSILERELEEWERVAAGCVLGSPEYFITRGQIDELRRTIQLFYLGFE
jgi:hypothetical protein